METSMTNAQDGGRGRYRRHRRCPHCRLPTSKRLCKTSVLRDLQEPLKSVSEMFRRARPTDPMLVSS
jgi:hypothetical protein